MGVSQVNDEIRKYKLAGSVKGTITSKLIYTMLNDLADINSEVQISVTRMSKTLKISEQAIRRSLKALENKGYIKIQNMYHSDGGNAANKYIIK
jgi:CTP-dependent riboflavin kinase